MKNQIQLVTFTLKNEEFAIDIHYVQEINKLSDTKLTAVPNVASYIMGFTNLRGKIIPVINFSEFLGHTFSEDTNNRKIIVININDKTLGLTVDSVSEVLRIDSSIIEPVPQLVYNQNDYLSGIVKLENKLITLIDIEKLNL